MTQQLQLVKVAVVRSLVFAPKKNSSSLLADWASLTGFTRITAVTGVPYSLGSEHGSYGIWSLNSCNLAVGWSEQLSPFLDTVVADKFHAHDEIATHELSEFVKERFSLSMIVGHT